jgi:peptide/nickel transport system permease protein
MNVASGPGVAASAAKASQSTLRARWVRRPPGVGFWVGVGLLSVYVAAAVSALFVFEGSLDRLTERTQWVSSLHPIGPSSAHPFGIMPGFGTDLFRALWQATPWDLGIVASILVIDVGLGLFLGGIAGLNEGGILDAIVTFVGDSVASIPAFLLVIVVLIGLATLAPQEVGLPAFVVVFGVVLWPTMARTVRERARVVGHETFVEAARASGAPFRRLLVRHVLPNSVGPVLAQVPLDVAPIFFVLAIIPWFVNCQAPAGPGGGSPTPVFLPHFPGFWPLPTFAFPEWGYLLGFGTCEGFSFPGGFSYWWMYLFPLLVILGLGLAIGLFCDGIDRWRRFDR